MPEQISGLTMTTFWFRIFFENQIFESLKKIQKIYVKNFFDSFWDEDSEFCISFPSKIFLFIFIFFRYNKIIKNSFLDMKNFLGKTDTFFRFLVPKTIKKNFYHKFFNFFFRDSKIWFSKKIWNQNLLMVGPKINF